MTLYAPRATDTQVDGPMFVPITEHEEVLASVRDAVRQRDELALELGRLESEAEQIQSLRRQLDEARARVAKGGGVTTREVLELRESVEVRDREIRRLKEANVGRERLLVDARDRIETLTHERAGLEGRLGARERALNELEVRAGSLHGDLQAEKRRCEEQRVALGRTSSELAQRMRELEHAVRDRDEAKARLQNGLNEADEALETAEKSKRTELHELKSSLERDLAAEKARNLELRQSLEAQLVEARSSQTESRATLEAQIMQLIVELAETRDSLIAAEAATESLRTATTLALNETVEESSAKFAKLVADHSIEMEAVRAANAKMVEDLRAEQTSTIEALEQANMAELAEQTASHANAIRSVRSDYDKSVDQVLLEAEKANGDLVRQLERANESLAEARAQQIEESQKYAAEITASREAHARDMTEVPEQVDRAVGEARLEAKALAATVQSAHDERLKTLEAAIVEERLKNEALARSHDEDRDRLTKEQYEYLEELSRAQKYELDRSRVQLIAEHADALAAAERASDAQKLELDRARVQLAAQQAEALASAERANDAQKLELERARVQLIAEHVEALAAAERANAAQNDRIKAEHRMVLDSREAALRSQAEKLNAEHAKALAAEQKEAQEGRVQLERMGQKLTDAMRRLSEGRRAIETETMAMATENKKLSSLVGELTTDLVAERAVTIARNQRRAVPEARDVDQVITALSEKLPESVTEELWIVRDSIIERLQSASTQNDESITRVAPSTPASA